MNGTPPASSTCACSLTRSRDRRVLLDVRQERARERGDQDRAGERRAERGAEVRHRVLHAADLGALLVGHRRDGDGAELRGERADPEPDQQHRHGDDLRRRRPRRAPPAGRRVPASSASRPPRTTSRGEASGRARDADRGDQQRDRQRQQPRRRSRAPTGRGRPTGTAARRRTRPACTRYWKKNIVSPPASWRFRSIDGSDERLPARASQPRLPAEEEPDARTGRRASARSSATARTTRARPPSAGPSPTRPSAARRRRTARARPPRAPRRPRRAAARVATGASAMRRVSTRIASDDHDLAREDPPPREVRRAEAADQRADGDRDRAGGRHQPVRGGPPLGREVRRRPARRSPAGSARRRRPRGTTSRAAAPAGSARARS